MTVHEEDDDVESPKPRVSSDPSTTSEGQSADRPASETDSDKARRFDGSAVKRSKLIVYLVILLAAAGIGTTSYFLALDEDNEDFHHEVRKAICVALCTLMLA